MNKLNKEANAINALFSIYHNPTPEYEEDDEDSFDEDKVTTNDGIYETYIELLDEGVCKAILGKDFNEEAVAYHLLTSATEGSSIVCTDKDGNEQVFKLQNDEVENNESVSTLSEEDSVMPAKPDFNILPILRNFGCALAVLLVLCLIVLLRS